MNTSSLTLNIPWTTRRSMHPSGTVSHAHPIQNPTPPPSATLDLSRASAQVLIETQAADNFLMLFLAGCSLVAITACALSIERFLAHWDAFETFVRASVG